MFICLLLKQTSGSGQKPVKILISEKTELSSIFYFEKVLFFAGQLCNKNVLEWFLPINRKEYTVTRSTNLSRNQPKLRF